MPTSPRRSRRIRSGAIAIGLVCGGVGAAIATVHTSASAFTANTDNPTNAWTAAGLTLEDDDASAVMFNVSGMVPGQVEQRCIAVTYTGTASTVGAIKVYSSLNSSTLGLPDALNVTIEEGTGATFGDCASFVSGATLVTAETLTAVSTSYTSYANGVGTVVPASSPQTVAYRFSVELDPDTANSVQGGTADVDFIWEIQSA